MQGKVFNKDEVKMFGSHSDPCDSPNVRLATYKFSLHNEQ